MELNSTYCQTSAPQFSILCGKRDFIEEGQKKTLTGYSVVEIDVAYSSTAC